MTIKKAIEIYLNWKKAHTNMAYSRYKVRLDRFMEHVGPRKQITQITGDDVVNFHIKMEENYSLGTVAYSTRILKNFFEFWKGRNQLNLNPKEIIPIRYTSAMKDIVTKEDFDIMADSLSEQFFDELQKKLVIFILWDTGMRISELIDLKIKDINPKGKGKLRTAKVRTRKTMRYNLVCWGAKTDQILTSYLGIRLAIDATCDNLLINPKTLKGYTVRTLQRWVKEIADQAMIGKDISPHCYRHSKAHEILNKKGNMRDVQALLRHVKPESSFTYTQLNEFRYQRVAQRFLTT